MGTVNNKEPGHMLLKKRPRVRFDINNAEHLGIARRFFQRSRWDGDGCPFKEVYPYQSVPDYIRSQIVSKFLGLETHG
jgi:hypothetical protein